MRKLAIIVEIRGEFVRVILFQPTELGTFKG
jgi:hypothetical protein